MKTLQINGEQFPFENPQYNDMDRRITGQHLFYCFTSDVPESRVQKMLDQGVIDIRALAEDKILTDYPEYQELTYYGTRKRGYYALLNKQVQKTMYWALNKQPASFTMIVNKIDGLTRKEDEPTDPNTVFGKIQLCLQLGVTVQLVIPETGYSCIIEPVCNKKQMDIFTKVFTCEKYLQQYNENTLERSLIPYIEDIKAKCLRLQEYRQAVQTEIWGLVNYAVAPYREEWKCENIYTLPTRMQYAVQAQTEQLLTTYAIDFNIKAEYALKLEDLQDPEVYQKMVDTVANYGPAFGMSVKTMETETEVTTYLPIEWLRNKIPESAQLKRAYLTQQSLRRAPLNELCNAYIQIDWYMSQEDVTEYLAEGYGICPHCGQILSRRDEFCPQCDVLNEMFEPDAISYEVMSYRLSKDDE